MQVNQIMQVSQIMQVTQIMQVNQNMQVNQKQKKCFKEQQKKGATTEYPFTIAFLKRHPFKTVAYLFICKLVAGYSEV